MPILAQCAGYLLSRRTGMEGGLPFWFSNYVGPVFELHGNLTYLPVLVSCNGFVMALLLNNSSRTHVQRLNVFSYMVTYFGSECERHQRPNDTRMEEV